MAQITGYLPQDRPPVALVSLELLHVLTMFPATVLVALLQSEAVDLFNPAQLAIGALILVIGIGGAAFPGGNVPIFGLELPAIATAALVGILLNLVFTLLPPTELQRTESAAPVNPLDVAETGALL